MYSLTQDRQFINDLKNAIAIRWHNVKHSQGLRTGHGSHGQVCPLTQLAIKLTKIIEEAGDRPLEDYRNCLRQMVLEQQFIDENGDSIIDDREMQVLEREVAMLIEVMETCRKQALERGGLSHCANQCSPPMFG